MAQRSRVIFGDTTGLQFENPKLKTAKRTRPLVEYLSSDDENTPVQRLRNLGGETVLEWPPVVPDFDPRGHRSVRNNYRPGKNAKASKTGLPGYVYSHKAAGNVPFHSNLEERLIIALELCPYVVEIRVQYPEWDEARLVRIVEQGGRMSKSEIMTLDIVATLKLPGCAEPKYHVISGKPSSLVEKPENQRRHSRERDAVCSWDATHEVMTELTVSYSEHGSNLLLLAFMRDVKNIEDWTDSAKAFANALKRTRIRGSLDRVLNIVSRRFNWDINTGYRIFSIAHFLGYLAWDHNYKLAIDRPMMLKGIRR
ncbi:hypothetical protein ACFFKC_05900 [Pseudoduganella danionis]|uniref:TnsA endonuclease N-terminal domain-containing protein n=1 Tax=Pseudoduganella danionis TaxID=1890295 RepID=A0ABW9SRN3_9BURK|nr:hypothetical protein [Pseudoduganella danionis]MTW34264.1 hypothetical protein [Pseudoduganella danionis]